MFLTQTQMESGRILHFTAFAIVNFYSIGDQQTILDIYTSSIKYTTIGR